MVCDEAYLVLTISVFSLEIQFSLPRFAFTRLNLLMKFLRFRVSSNIAIAFEEILQLMILSSSR